MPRGQAVSRRGREEAVSKHSHGPGVEQHPQLPRLTQAPSPRQQMQEGEQDPIRQRGLQSRGGAGWVKPGCSAPTLPPAHPKPCGTNGHFGERGQSPQPRRWDPRGLSPPRAAPGSQCQVSVGMASQCWQCQAARRHSQHEGSAAPGGCRGVPEHPWHRGGCRAKGKLCSTLSGG